MERQHRACKDLHLALVSVLLGQDELLFQT